MRYLVLSLLVSVIAGAEVIPDFSSETLLGELWYKQEVYFRPVKAGELNWNGLMYHSPSKRCFELLQPGMADKVKYRQSHCEADFLKAATEPYTKIADFKKFKEAFLTCVDKIDKPCLRGMISRTLSISFGVDGYQDRRDMIFADWKKDNFEELARLIRKGIVTDGAYRRFPPKPSDGGMGQRGAFQLYDGGWQLESYLAGD